MALSGRDVTVRLKADISSYIASMGLAGKATNDFTTSLNNSATSGSSGFSKIGIAAAAATAGMVALGVGAYQAVSAFTDFDQAMSAVEAATMASAATMGQLEAAALEAGKSTVFSAEEAARGMEALAKAGISTSDIMGGALTGALDLAAAGEIDVASAAEIAATAMTQFNLAGSEVPHVADLLAAAAGKAQGSVADMGAAMNQSGLVASQMGLSIEETVGTLAAFASAGLIGSDAGTSFRTMLLRLANPSQEAAQLMEQLGISVYDAQGNFIGMEGVAGELSTSLSGLSEEQRNAALATIFGSDAIRGASILYEQGAAGIANWTSEVNDQGYAAEQAAIKTDNLAGDMERLGGAIDAALIQAGGAADAILRGLVQTLTGAVESLSGMGSALSVLEPLWDSLAGILENVWTILGNLVSAIEPVVTGFLTLAGGAVLAGLELIANILEGITGFLAENEAVVTALALTVGGVLVASFVKAQVAAVALFVTTAQANAAAAGMTLMGAAGNALGTSLNTAAVAAKGLLASLGPLAVIAVGAVAVTGLLNMGSASADATAQIEDLKQALAEADGVSEWTEVAAQGMDDLASSVESLSSKLNDMTSTTSVGDWFADAFSYFADGPNAIADTELAIARLESEMRLLESTQRLVESNTIGLSKALGISGDAVQALADKYGIELTGSLENLTPTFEKLLRIEQQTTSAQDEAAAAAEGLASGFLDAAQAADAFMTILDEMTGNFQNSLQAYTEYEAGLRDFAALFDEIGTSGVDAAGNLDLTTEAGEALSNQLQSTADDIMGVVDALLREGRTEEAAAQYTDMRDKFIEDAMAMGLSEAAANTLADGLLGIPSEVLTTIGMTGDQDVAARAQGIKNALAGIPTLTQASVEVPTGTADADIASIKAKLTELILSPWQPNVVAFGDVTDPEAKLNAIIKASWRTTVYGDGNTDDANAKLSAIINASWRTTVYGDGDTTDAWNDLSATINTSWRTTVYGDGNVDNAWNALSSVVNTSWNTTIYASAETSAAEAKLNYAARDRTSYVKQVTITSGVASGGLLSDPGYAGGGRIHGPGTGTSDSIPARFASGGDLRVSDGEYIVNAADTAKNLAALEAANWGHKRLMVAPGYAAGGVPQRTVPGYAMGGQPGVTVDMLRDALQGMGADITNGTFGLDTSGFVKVMDGRIQLSDKGKRQAARAGQRRSN